MLTLTKLACNVVPPVKMANTKVVSYRTNYVTTVQLPAMNFVENFYLIMYWNKLDPKESVVELRYRNRLDGWGDSHPIDPSLLRTILSDNPRYRDAIVDIAPGRSFIKGLCGDYVVQLDTYMERTSDSLAGSLVFDHGQSLAMALSFPGKVKSIFGGDKVVRLVTTIDYFVGEMHGIGTYSGQIKEINTTISGLHKKVSELDTYMSEDYNTFERCKETLAKFGIEYSLEGD